MGLRARPTGTYEAVLEGALPGLTTVGVRVIDPPAGDVVTARVQGVAGGIVESAPGVYAKVMTAPGTVGDYLVVWDYGDPLDADQQFTEQLRVTATTLEFAEITPESVLAAMEEYMAGRLRESTFETGGSAAGGGARVEHFTANTWPTAAMAERVATRMASMIVRDFAGADDDDLADLLDIAALRGAIALEGASYPEQVASERSPARLWMDLLERSETDLRARLPVVADAGEDEGGPGLDPVWYFGPLLPVQHIAEGAEGPLLPAVRTVSRRRVW